MQIPKPIIKSLQEGGRVFLLGFVSWLLTDGVLDGILAWCCGSILDPSTKQTITSLLFIALRMVDKWLHEEGKEQQNAGMTLGLTRF